MASNTTPRILHLSAVGNWGGGEHHIESLITELRRLHPDAFNMIHCVAGAQFNKRLELASPRFNYTTAPRKYKIDWRYVRSIITTCKMHKINLIHIHDPTAHQLAVIASLFCKLPPMILSKKISFPVKNRFLTRLKYNHQCIKRYLCVSQETADVLRPSLKRPELVETIYHGTRLDNKSIPAPFDIKDHLNLPAETVIVGNIANHYGAKDLPTLLNVVEQLKQVAGLPAFHVVQIGKHLGDTPDLIDDAKRRGLGSHLTFLGFQTNASSFIPQFSTLLMTSVVEGVPQTIYEANFHHVPVVTTNAGGISEVVLHEKTGYVTEKRATEDLVRGIRIVLTQHDIVRQWVDDAYSRFMTHFTSEVMADRTYQVYQSILQSGSQNE
ncbi:MAG: glycosyltransferase family 4 protein [Natronospirillum sp.]